MPDLLDQPSAALRQLAARLRDLRLDADLDQASLAARLRVAQPQVSRIENARRIPSSDVVARWAGACAASAADRDALVELREAAASERISWRRVHERGLARDQQSYGDMERRAVGIRVFQCSVIPGQLQIGAYARRLFELCTDKTPDEVAAGVQARLDRQLVLHDPPPEGCRFIITEAALRWRPAGDTDGRLLAAQLDRLLAVFDLPGVDLRVLGWEDPQPSTHRHPFVHLVLAPEDGDDEPAGVVIVETLDGEDVIRSAERLTVYRDYFDLVAAQARSGEDARELIGRVMREVRDER
ncbi:MAG: helix-turn-helix transcriptional regulator [Actinomycetota bacterium]|nr:helix-turn-helix transcriptional regulator [Actinomycetota bacterium]